MGSVGGAIAQWGQCVRGAIAQQSQWAELLRSRVSGWSYCAIESVDGTIAQ